VTAGWDDELSALRILYLREARSRLDELDGLLDVLEATGDDARALQDLRRAFHGFAGSGATYGLPAVSALGLAGERRCGAVRSGPAVASDLRLWRETAAGLRREVEAAETAAPAVSDAPSPPTVVVVDEDPGDLQSLTLALEQEGFAVRAEPRLAGVLATGGLPEALIVDASVDQGAAFALVTSIRARADGAKAVVFVIGKHGGVLDRVEAIHCGADGHFTKPVDTGAMVRRLRFLLEREQAEPPRILSIEDDPQQAAFVRTVLTSGGCEVRTVADPLRLEAELAAFRPDLVLMDVLLPGVSGYDLVRSLRQDERFTTLPVIILTTRGELDARIEAARAGGDEHLVKPVSPGLLLSTVVARVERGRFLRLLVERDGLTGLLTHTTLLERARSAVARKRREPRRQWVWMMIDLDRFKDVNDTHGHPAGDRVLIRLAGLLRARLRAADVIGRYGGEEFAVVLEDISGGDAVRLVERLRAEFAGMEQMSRERVPFRVTFSAGLAALEDGETVSSWVNAADRALYEAKEGGRNRVVLSTGPFRGTA
jgi:diguanylate cyclase (GGDEF)-like protein